MYFAAEPGPVRDPGEPSTNPEPVSSALSCQWTRWPGFPSGAASTLGLGIASSWPVSLVFNLKLFHRLFFFFVFYDIQHAI